VNDIEPDQAVTIAAGVMCTADDEITADGSCTSRKVLIVRQAG